MAKKRVRSVDELIEALGGLTASSKLLGKTPRQVWNWRERGLPGRLYLVHKKILERHGIEAPPELWNIAQDAAA